MARFTTAARALRGPFKKLVRKLELTLRKPIVKKLGPVGRHIDARFRAKDAESALAGAAAKAASLRDLPKKSWPRAASAAVDSRTGAVVGLGKSGGSPVVPPSLRSVLPSPSLSPWWEADNCAEVAAASEAIGNGSALENLVIRTVRVIDGLPFDPCPNCKTWAV